MDLITLKGWYTTKNNQTKPNQWFDHIPWGYFGESMNFSAHPCIYIYIYIYIYI